MSRNTAKKFGYKPLKTTTNLYKQEKEIIKEHLFFRQILLGTYVCLHMTSVVNKRNYV